MLPDISTSTSSMAATWNKKRFKYWWRATSRNALSHSTCPIPSEGYRWKKSNEQESSNRKESNSSSNERKTKMPEKTSINNWNVNQVKGAVAMASFRCLPTITYHELWWRRFILVVHSIGTSSLATGDAGMNLAPVTLTHQYCSTRRLHRISIPLLVVLVLAVNIQLKRLECFFFMVSQVMIVPFSSCHCCCCSALLFLYCML